MEIKLTNNQINKLIENTTDTLYQSYGCDDLIVKTLRGDGYYFNLLTQEKTFLNRIFSKEKQVIILKCYFIQKFTMRYNRSQVLSEEQRNDATLIQAFKNQYEKLNKEKEEGKRHQLEACINDVLARL